MDAIVSIAKGYVMNTTMKSAQQLMAGIDLYTKIRTACAILSVLLTAVGLCIVIHFHPMQVHCPQEKQNAYSNCNQCHRPGN